MRKSASFPFFRFPLPYLRGKTRSPFPLRFPPEISVLLFCGQKWTSFSLWCATSNRFSPGGPPALLVLRISFSLPPFLSEPLKFLKLFFFLEPTTKVLLPSLLCQNALSCPLPLFPSRKINRPSFFCEAFSETGGDFLPPSRCNRSASFLASHSGTEKEAQKILFFFWVCPPLRCVVSC